MEALEAVGKYSDPFYAECRAFGRLQETGHESLAVKCHGYVLLDEKHEELLMPMIDKPSRMFGDRPFYSNIGNPPAPIRCIIKDLGGQSRLTRQLAQRVFEDIKALHQLGIVSMDMKLEQLIDGKIADFSVAKTLPHFVTCAELNPKLPVEWSHMAESALFLRCRNDFVFLDEMIHYWNSYAEKDSLKVTFRVPGCSRDSYSKHSLRRNPKQITPGKQRVYTLVDPRRRVWKAKRRNGKVPLKPNPMKWYESEDARWGAKEFDEKFAGWCMSWEYRDGLIFPVGRYSFQEVDGEMKLAKAPQREPTTEREAQIYSDNYRRQVLEMEAEEYVESDEVGSEIWYKDFVNGRRQ